MKSERGVTLTSIMIYVVALTIVVTLFGRITTYFYRNMNQVTTNTSAYAEYTKFNSYFTDEINIQGNEVAVCESNYIIFSKSQNQYTYQNEKIYVNKRKICDDVQECNFSYDEVTQIITVEIKIFEKEYKTTYTVAR